MKTRNSILVFALAFFAVQGVVFAQSLHLEDVNQAVDSSLDAIDKLRFVPGPLPTGSVTTQPVVEDTFLGPDLDSLIDGQNSLSASSPSSSPTGGGLGVLPADVAPVENFTVET